MREIYPRGYHIAHVVPAPAVFSPRMRPRVGQSAVTAEEAGMGGRALREADEAGVRGKNVTPFLLARLHALSGGATEEANKQLVWSNAALAARIAAAL